MKLVTTGSTRWVLLIGKYAVKVPRPDYGSRQFVLGMFSNIQEREISIDARNDPRLTRTYWCAPLGLLAVSERVGPVIRRRLTREEIFSLPLQEFSGEAGVDDNGHNVAVRENGKLVVVDYGNPGLMYTYMGPRLVNGEPRG